MDAQHPARPAATTERVVDTRVAAFSDETVAAACALLLAGDLVALPTETVYGLAGDATNPAAVAAIFAAKRRPVANPLIVHVADRAAAERLAVIDDAACRLAEAFWPGPLTLVLPRRPGSGIADAAAAGLPTIAVRVPAHRAIRAVLTGTGRPLAAPSANSSGSISPTRAVHVLAGLGGRVPLVIDDGASPAGLESTIVAATGGGVRILRPGPITRAMIAACVGDVLAEHTGAPAGSARALEAPGQLTAHYAPTKPLRIGAVDARDGEWLIGFGDIPGDATLSASGDLREAAARLFDLLHRADAADAPRIAVAAVPQLGIGVAINDRLTRAAAGAGKGSDAAE